MSTHEPLEADVIQTPASDVSELIQALVDDLKDKECILTPQVEAAFRAVPRHLFVPAMPLDSVYLDRSIPVKKDQNSQLISSSSQPAIMAIMLEQLGLEPGHRVLEIGAGTGYNAALMAHIVGEGGQVVTVDIDEDLVKAAREHLAAAGVNQVQVVCADGGYGYASAAPYDRIILTVGAWDILPAWFEQMKPAGRLVLPLLLGNRQWSIAFERTDDHLTSLSIRGCGFMMLRGAFAPPESEMQLGPDPGLMIDVDEEQPLDPERVYAWLTGVRKDWDTGIEVRLREVRSWLEFWPGSQDIKGRTLVARGEMVDRNLVPPLLVYNVTGLGGEWRSAMTLALVGNKGLAVLMRAPGQPVPLADPNEPPPPDTPFPLYVRQFGTDESLAKRILAQVKAWDDAGRPSPKVKEPRSIRAYQKATDPSLLENESVIDTKWARLVVDWSAVS